MPVTRNKEFSALAVVLCGFVINVPLALHLSGGGRGRVSFLFLFFPVDGFCVCVCFVSFIHIEGL